MTTIALADTSSEVEQQEDNSSVHFRALLFKDGTELIVSVMDYDLDWTKKKFIVISEPVVCDSFGDLHCWSNITDQYQIEISTSDIRAMYMIKESVEEKYDEYLEAAYYEGLREDLKDPELPDEIRVQLEDILTNGYDGSEPLDQPAPVMFNYLPLSSTIH